MAEYCRPGPSALLFAAAERASERIDRVYFCREDGFAAVASRKFGGGGDGGSAAYVSRMSGGHLSTIGAPSHKPGSAHFRHDRRRLQPVVGRSGRRRVASVDATRRRASGRRLLLLPETAGDEKRACNVRAAVAAGRAGTRCRRPIVNVLPAIASHRFDTA